MFYGMPYNQAWQPDMNHTTRTKLRAHSPILPICAEQLQQPASICWHRSFHVLNSFANFMIVTVRSDSLSPRWCAQYQDDKGVKRQNHLLARTPEVEMPSPRIRGRGLQQWNMCNHLWIRNCCKVAEFMHGTDSLMLGDSKDAASEPSP